MALVFFFFLVFETKVIWNTNPLVDNAYLFTLLRLKLIGLAFVKLFTLFSLTKRKYDTTIIIIITTRSDGQLLVKPYNKKKRLWH